MPMRFIPLVKEIYTSAPICDPSTFPTPPAAETSPLTRMILISAYPDREFRRQALSAGAIAFLDKKDLDTASVRQVVEDALR
jgi:CheY-like chemotaxis protein